MVHRVFVFGTLKAGFPNFAVNAGRRIPGSYRTRERYPLYLVGDRNVPWMLDLRGEGEQVAGEVYEVDEATLAAMDRLERVAEPDGYRRVSIVVEREGVSVEAFCYLKPAAQLLPALKRAGPLAEYTLEHAREYRPRATPAIRGIIFDLFHTLTARESEWSDEPPTCDMLGFDRHTWDVALTESSRWRLVGEERDPYSILSRLARHVDPQIPEERIRRALETRLRRFDQVFQRIPEPNVATLRHLRSAGYKLALLSNADAMEVASYSRGPLAGLFDAEVFSCDAGYAKPEPEIFHACLEALGLEAHECVFVGDGGSDELRGAKLLGMRTIFVSGVIEEIFPERVAPRAAIADHHVRWVPQVLEVLA